MDAVAPSLSLTTFTTAVTSATWSWSCDDAPCSFRHIINTSATHTFTTESFTTTATATQDSGDARYYLHVQARDAAGNLSAAMSSEARLDNTPPVATFSFSPSEPVKSARWDWICNESSCDTRYALNTSATHTFTTETFESFPNPPVKVVHQTSGDGDYYVHIQVRDAAGNISTVVTRRVELDNTAPSITGLSHDSTAAQSKTWTWSCDDTPCKYRHVINQNPTHTFAAETYSNTATATLSQGLGTYYLHVQARDVAGNESTVASYSALLEAKFAFSLSGTATPSSSTWNWSCGEGVSCNYRHITNTSATYDFGLASYNTTSSSTLTPRFGNYLHVQARNPDDWTDFSEVLTLEARPLNRLSGRRYTTCVVLSTGAVKCWGKGDLRTLGDGVDSNTHSSNVPVDVSGITNAVQVSVGRGHACALLSTGAVKCWGGNQDGALGNNTRTDSATPVDVSDLSDVIQVAAGERHTCALLNSGTLKCWGDDTYGQSGLRLPSAANNRQLVPAQVSHVSGVVSLAVGAWHTCALLRSGGVKCWGYGEHGRLGHGRQVGSRVPVDVTGLSSGVVHLDAGDEHTCAVLATGAVKCWGRGEYGRLGNNHATNDNSDVPVDVTGITNALQVSTGYSHTCARLSTGAVQCWGRGRAGALGNDEDDDSKTPVAVSGLSTALEVTVGEEYACALLANGSTKCWGEGRDGRLGSGGTTDSDTPVDVVVSSAQDAAAVEFGTTWKLSYCYKSATSNYLCQLTE